MIVEVRLFATFRKGRFKEKPVELADGSSVADLLEDLMIPVKDARILLVNGIAALGEHKLAANDVVAIFPPIAGG